MSKSNNQGNLFCFGLGYSAQFLAKRLIPKNWLVSGSCRDPKAITSIKKIGVSAYLYDGKSVSPKILDAIHKATHILISIPPQKSGDVVLQHCGSIFLKSKHLKWVGYISSTGVYGDSKGEWVDETSPLNQLLPVVNGVSKLNPTGLNSKRTIIYQL